MLREHGDKAKSIWTHLDDSASAWSSLLGRRFLPLGSPASAGLFWAPALPKLNRSPSEAPVSQSNCRLLIVDGRHLLRIIFVLLQLNLAWRRMRCYGELSRGAACSRLPSKSFSSTRERRGWPTGGDEIGPRFNCARVSENCLGWDPPDEARSATGMGRGGLCGLLRGCAEPRTVCGFDHGVAPSGSRTGASAVLNPEEPAQGEVRRRHRSETPAPFAQKIESRDRRRPADIAARG